MESVESWGATAREAGETRESNPYLEHAAMKEAQPFLEAWYCGWDAADAALKAPGT